MAKFIEMPPPMVPAPMTPQEVSDYIAQAGRDAWLVPDVPADTPRRKIEKVGVIGAGTMGGGI
ncbi:MAG: hypothetical protein AAFW60_08845, partial [Pseudomonadota bacterium]